MPRTPTQAYLQWLRGSPNSVVVVLVVVVVMMLLVALARAPTVIDERT